jgi:hypothetical protein
MMQKPLLPGASSSDIRTAVTTSQEVCRPLTKPIPVQRAWHVFNEFQRTTRIGSRESSVSRTERALTRPNWPLLGCKPSAINEAHRATMANALMHTALFETQSGR